MLAGPELLIATEHRVSYPILSLMQVAGIVVIFAGASRLRPRGPGAVCSYSDTECRGGRSAFRATHL